MEKNNPAIQSKLVESSDGIRWVMSRGEVEVGRFEISASAGDMTEVMIYGDIGDTWDPESVAAADFVRAIAGIQTDYITVRLNSFGGSVPDGTAIHNALRRHPSVIDVEIDGVAVSIASLIAMAGDTTRIAENGLMMIHAPWTLAMGNAVDMREAADVLDKHADAMASSYASKTGTSIDEFLAVLKSKENVWYTAQEALDAGLVDEIIPARELAALQAMSRFSVPAAVAAAFRPSKEVTQMSTKTDPKPAATVDIAIPPTQPDVSEIERVAEAKAHERIKARNIELRSICKSFMNHEGVREVVDACMADPHITLEQARTKVLDKLGEGCEPLAGNPRIDVGQSGRERFIADATEVLTARANVGNVASGNGLRGLRLVDLAREALVRANISTAGMDVRALVAAAFTQSTSDLPVILENTMHKVLLTAYGTAPDVWRQISAIGSVSDFRAHNRYRLGSFGNLDSRNELGEFKNKTIPDGEKSSISAGTKGNIINISREAIINDDLDAFTGLARMLGRAAARTIEADVFALLASNPAMSDGIALFHASHGNLAAVGAVQSVATWDAGRVAIAKQKDISGNDYLDIRPAIVLCGVGVGGDARVINDAQYDPDTANKLQRPNKVRGLVNTVVDTPRITGTEWYLLADPNDAPVIEVVFLNGEQNPYLEVQNGFTVDGAQYKVRLDSGVGIVDYRGGYKNPGA